MTHDEMIAVIQAHKEGKTIEYLGASGIFKEMPAHLAFNFASLKYRIKPEPTREEITAKWVKDNDVKAGDKVFVIKRVEDFNKWASLMGISSFTPMEILDISDHGIMLSDGFCYDVEYLQKVTSKTVPFTFEDRDEFRGKWVRYKGQLEEYLILTIGKDSALILGTDGTYQTSYSSMFDRMEFIDGKPFGKEIWE
jgi:hypothetical protein